MYSNSWFKILSVLLFEMTILSSNCWLTHTFSFNHLRPDNKGKAKWVYLVNLVNKVRTTQQQKTGPTNKSIGFDTIEINLVWSSFLLPSNKWKILHYVPRFNLYDPQKSKGFKCSNKLMLDYGDIQALDPKLQLALEPKDLKLEGSSFADSLFWKVARLKLQIAF